MGRTRKIGSAHLQLFTNLISAFVVYTKLETVSIIQGFFLMQLYYILIYFHYSCIIDLQKLI